MFRLLSEALRSRSKSKFLSARDELEIFDLLRINGGSYTQYIQALVAKRYQIEGVLAAALVPVEFSADERTHVDFCFGEEWRAAAVLLPLSGDHYPVEKKSQGKKAIDSLFDDIDYCRSQIEENWPNCPELSSKRLPDLARLQIRHAFEANSREKALSRLDTFKHELCEMSQQRKSRTNRRAYDVALALRAIFEYYNAFPIALASTRPDEPTFDKPVYKVGTKRHENLEPKCRYMIALNRVYEILEINVTLHHYAAKANKAPKDDPILCRFAAKLRTNYPDQTQFPLVLSEFGWTKNSTAISKVPEMYEEFYSYRELKRCYRKYMRMNASTTTPIKN